MGRLPKNPRIPEAKVDRMFYERWSPRALSEEPVPLDKIKSLFEAARWAPSSYNEQPWLFLFASKPADRELFLSLLVEKNRLWAQKAPVLMFAVARRNFKMTGKENVHAAFDTGAAWMSLALEARKLGLYAHGMAGFDREKAYETLKVPKDEYEIIAAVALGGYGDPSLLPEDMRKIEYPNERKRLSEVLIEGVFKK